MNKYNYNIFGTFMIPFIFQSQLFLTRCLNIIVKIKIKGKKEKKEKRYDYKYKKNIKTMMLMNNEYEQKKNKIFFK